MQKRVITTFMFSMLLLCLPMLASATPDPLSVLKPASNRMLSELKRNRSKLRNNPNYVYTLVRRIILPHVDLYGMSRSVLGRHAWTTTAPSQQRAFTKVFTDVVIGTYASALNAYQDETMKFYPIRGGYQGKRRVYIQSKVIRADGPDVSVGYRMALQGNRWKMYDLVVEGVSLLQSFHAQFTDELSRGKSVAQLTSELKRRGRR